MTLLHRSCVAILFVVSCLLTTFAKPANASVINTLPPQFWLGDNPPRSIGGTFRPTDSILKTFRVSLDDGPGAQHFRLVVYSTNALGHPDTLLWQGPETYKSSFLAEYEVSPDLHVDPTKTYFIGFDTGLFTTVPSHSGYLAIGVRTGNPIPEGSVFFNTGGGWIQEPGNDIATRITMVPTPSTLALGVIGLLISDFCRTRRKK